MLTEMLRRAAAANSAKVAIVQGETRLRYDQLYDLSVRCASGLRQLGIRSADCVAVVLPNCPEFIIALFACARLRAIMLPLNPQYTKEELQRFLVDARARVVITDAPRAALCQEIVAGLGREIRLTIVGSPIEGAVGFAELEQHPPVVEPTGTFAGPALYLYTSGSTDTYKRVCCTQENLFHEAYNFVETIRLTAEDNILCTIPLYHSYGLGNCLLDAVYAASSLVLLEPVEENGVIVEVPFAGRCQRVLELMREEAIRFYPGVPYQFALLAALAEDERADLSGLKLCVSSGDVLPEQTFQRFLSRFGRPIRSLYGSTEAGSICINADPDETFEPGSLGAPLKNVSIQIRDEMGRELSENQSGHIWVKSPVIPPDGYDGWPELNARQFRDGYFNTGDIGKKDARGHLVMTGRKQTFVSVGGYKVDIGEVEEVLQSHPRVREAAVIGIEVPNVGELIKAVVVTRDVCQEAEILAYCRERLAPYKVPRLLEFRDALPRNPLGKILKKDLGDFSQLLRGTDGSETPAKASLPGETLAVGRRKESESMPARQEVAPVSDIMHRLRAAPADRREAILGEFVKSQVALVLRHQTRAISPTQGFFQQGMDSLAAVELSARLQDALNCRLATTYAFDYPTIEALAQHLNREVLQVESDGGRAPQKTDPITEEALEKISREDIAALLAHELKTLEDGKKL